MKFHSAINSSGGDEVKPIKDLESVDARILIVDDEKDILDYLVDIFAPVFTKVESASNGNEAYEKLLNGKFDLLLSDIRMPEMSGPELLKKVRSTKGLEDLKVLFITGGSFESEQSRERFEGVIAKPFSDNELIKRAREILTH